MDLETTIQEKVHALPVEQQEEVLEFVENLEQRKTPIRKLHELIESHFGDLSPEEIAALPEDGSYNLDHYAYGSPKK
jgi:transcriptional regulator of NAD metabolism